MTEDEKAVRKVITDWIDATAKGDLDRVLSLMTEEMEFITAGGPPFGKKQFAENSRGMKFTAFSGRPDIREVEVAGEWAYVRQDLTVEMTPAGGAPMRLKGPILSIFRKGGDQRWRLHRDANFVAPEKAPA